MTRRLGEAQPGPNGELDPPNDEVDWDAVREWVPRLEQHEHRGIPGGFNTHDNGQVWLDTSQLDPAQGDCIAQMIEAGLLSMFDWQDWMDARGGQLWRHHELIDSASLDDCRRLLIALWRGDRFNDNLLLEVFETGFILRLLKRMVELAPGSTGND